MWIDIHLEDYRRGARLEAECAAGEYLDVLVDMISADGKVKTDMGDEIYVRYYEYLCDLAVDLDLLDAAWLLKQLMDYAEEIDWKQGKQGVLSAAYLTYENAIVDAFKHFAERLNDELAEELYTTYWARIDDGADPENELSMVRDQVTQFIKRYFKS